MERDHKNENVPFDYRTQKVENASVGDAPWRDSAKFKITTAAAPDQPPAPDGAPVVLHGVEPSSGNAGAPPSSTVPPTPLPSVPEGVSSGGSAYRKKGRGLPIVLVAIAVCAVLLIVGIFANGLLMGLQNDDDDVYESFMAASEASLAVMYEQARPAGSAAYVVDSADDKGRAYKLVVCPVTTSFSEFVSMFDADLVPAVREDADYRYDDIVEYAPYEAIDDLESRKQLYAAELLDPARIAREAMEADEGAESVPPREVTLWAAYKVRDFDLFEPPVVLMLTHSADPLSDTPGEYRFIEYPDVVAMTADEFDSFAKEQLQKEEVD